MTPQGERKVISQWKTRNTKRKSGPMEQVVYLEELGSWNGRMKYRSETRHECV